MSTPRKFSRISIFTGSILVLLFSSANISHVVASNCATFTAPTNSVGSAATASAYTSWKTNYLTGNGAGGDLRVQRSDYDGYDTVSEGIAYGMLFSAYLDDKPTFDKLLAYEQRHLDNRGLMNWRIDANGNTTGHNSATDSDEDMAVALIVAGKRWGGDYASKAVTQINKIMQYEVENGSNVLKPGDDWGGSDVLNPSYIAPSYYTLFKTVTGNSRWDDVYTANYNVLAASDRASGGSTTGLVPDWSNAAGNQANGMSYSYGYDAVRSPLRMAISANWDCDSTAINRLKPFNTFFASKDIKTVVDGYTTTGNAIGGYHSPAFVGAVASAATTSGNTTVSNNAWDELVATTGGGYYHESIRLLSLLVSSGQFINPMTVSASSAPNQTPPSAPPAPPTSSTNLNVWWPVDGARVVGTQPFKAMLEDNTVDNYRMYWQVDDGVLNDMADNYEDYPHKQADVNVSNWGWQPSGKYKITFVVKNLNGATIATKSSIITIN